MAADSFHSNPPLPFLSTMIQQRTILVTKSHFYFAARHINMDRKERGERWIRMAVGSSPASAAFPVLAAPCGPSV